MRGSLALLALLWGAAAAACTVPDGGTAPFHRAVTRVKYLPETEALVNALARESHKSRGSLQFVLSLDSPVRVGGRCFWPLEVRANGEPWNGFLVSPDGRRVLVLRAHGSPLTLAAWRRQSSRK